MQMIRRQRRRLGLYGLCLALSACALLVVLGRSPQVLITLGGGFAGAMLIACVSLSVIPRKRRILDGIILIAAVMVPMWSLATYFALPQAAALSLSVIIVVALKRLPNKLIPPRNFTDTQRFRTPQSAYALWAAHLPDPGLLDRHWSSELQSLRLDHNDPDVRIATYEFPEGTVKKTLLLTALETHQYFAYDFQQDGGASGTYTFKIAENGPTCDVTISLTLNALPFSVWLSAWVDDILRDEVDHHRAIASGAADRSLTASRLTNAPAPQTGLIPPEPVPAAFAELLSA